MEVRWACGWGCIAVAPGMHFWKHSLPVVCCSCSSVIVLPFKYSLVKNSAPRATGAALSCFYDFQGEQFEIELSSARRGYTFFGKLSRPRECFMCSTSIYVYTSRHTSPMHRDTCTECVCVCVYFWAKKFWYHQAHLFLSMAMDVLMNTACAHKEICWYKENVFVITSSITVLEEIMIKTSIQFC